MSSSFLDYTLLMIWGFLVGFVGWGSCPRLLNPIAIWLIGTERNNIKLGITRVVIALFLIFSIFCLLILLPLLLIVHGTSLSRVDEWRSLSGTTYIGSLVGFLSFRMLRGKN